MPSHRPYNYVVVRVVREDPDRAGLLYAGTEFGMFISFDDGESWQSFQLNLPVTPITDLKVVDKDLVMSTMGRSFWILYDLTPLHEIDASVAAASAHLFAVKDPYRVRTRRRPGGSTDARPPDEPQYPEVGANIDYYLASEPEGELALDILDADGDVIRSFSSDDSGETNVVPPDAGMGTPKLEKSAGMHRFTWQLRYPGPWHEDAERSGRMGPMVAPGSYQARFTLGSWSRTVSFEAKLDPRVVAEGYVSSEDIVAQVELGLKARDALSRARLASARLDDALTSATGATRTALEELKQELVTAPRRYSQPMLIDQLSYLYANLDRADQRPGVDAFERYQSLKRQLDEQVAKLDELLGGSS